jgi:uncharacterized membrane protein YeaQ/YmgE (transglycosylase-associated protein family)
LIEFPSKADKEGGMKFEWSFTNEHGLRRWCERDRRRHRVGRGRSGPKEDRSNSVVGFVVFGLVVGALARLVVPGRQHLSIVTTLVLGLIGSVVGGVVANAIGTGDIFELNILGSIVAIVTAIVLIVVGDRVGLLAKRSSSR